MTSDFGQRSRTLNLLADVLGGVGELNLQSSRLKKWMAPRRGGWRGRLAVSAEVRPTPKGVVGVMGPWNFPVSSVVTPAAAALAAGNRVMLRPSEISATTTAALARLAPRYFDADELAIVTDGQADGPTFARLRFDHLFFTGSPRVGALVAAAAGANLVPVTLELGGKNPAVVDSTADLAAAARRIADARMANGGQVCLCPDYALVPEKLVDEFTEAVLAHWRSRYPHVADSPDYTAIINAASYERVVSLIEDARARGAVVRDAAPRGEALPDARSRTIAPTVVTGVTPGMAIAEQEIFGPVLAVHGYRDIAQAIDYIAARPSPLTLYWFGARRKSFERLISRTASGSVNVGDFGAATASPDMPFGGVGNSGSGYAHGRYGFDTFSHLRPVAASRLPFSTAAFLGGPTSPFIRRAVEFQVRRSSRGRRSHSMRIDESE